MSRVGLYAIENSQTTGASATTRTKQIAKRRTINSNRSRSNMPVPSRLEDHDEAGGHEEDANDDQCADGGGGTDVEKLEPLFDAIDHQRVGRVGWPTAGGDEDDVEHPEGVHHPQDQREKGRGHEQRN